MSDPAVSVLLAVRDNAEFLPAALEGISAQTFRNFEVVAVDDGSRDATAAILARYAECTPRVTVLTNPEALGLAGALNCGLAACRAPLIARADGDDLYMPDRLERQRAFLDAHPEIGVLSCAFHRIDREGRRLATVSPVVEDRLIRFQMMFMNSLSHSGVMFRRDLVTGVGGYDEAYWTAQDSDLWARLRPLTKFAILPEPLMEYRIHAASTVRTRGSRGRALSLSVPQRLISEYVGHEVSPEDTRAMVDLYQGAWEPGRAELARGERGLTRVLRIAARQESPDVVRFFRERVAASFLRRGSAAVEDNPRFAAWALARSLAWQPGRQAIRGLGRVGFRGARAIRRRVGLS